MPRCAEAAIASWRPHTTAAPGYESAAEVQGPSGLARQSSIARCDSASSQAFQQHSTVHPLTGLPPQPNAPMHAPLRRYDSDLEGGTSKTSIWMASSPWMCTMNGTLSLKVRHILRWCQVTASLQAWLPFATCAIGSWLFGVQASVSLIFHLRTSMTSQGVAHVQDPCRGMTATATRITCATPPAAFA